MLVLVSRNRLGGSRSLQPRHFTGCLALSPAALAPSWQVDSLRLWHCRSQKNRSVGWHARIYSAEPLCNQERGFPLILKAPSLSPLPLPPPSPPSPSPCCSFLLLLLFSNCAAFSNRTCLSLFCPPPLHLQTWLLLLNPVSGPAWTLKLLASYLQALGQRLLLW